MRTLSTGLAAHLEGAATTTAHAWRLTRRDGLALGFTEHDRDLDFAGTLFRAATGFQAGEVETALGLSADAADVAGAFSDSAIGAEDLADGRYDGAMVACYLVNWANPADHVLLWTRQLGEVRATGNSFRAELRSLAARLDRPQGRLYTRRCDAELGDARCGFALSTPGFSASGTVIGMPDASGFAVDGVSAFASGWFRQGRLTFTGGRFAGLAFQIGEHRVDNGVALIALWAPLATAPAVGDSVTLSAGCDKTLSTCVARFQNSANFQGFPFMPGSDFAYGYADGDSVHDGRPVTP